MTQLADLTAAGDTVTLPGYTLSPFRLEDFGQAEAEFAQLHIQTAAKAAAGLPDAMQDKVIAAATRDVALKLFVLGSPAFDAAAKSNTALPLLLWLALRARHPDATRLTAAKLITRENERAVQEAVLKCAGYTFQKKQPPGTPAEPTPSGGDESSPPSENAA